jgi:hypothetical protein
MIVFQVLLALFPLFVGAALWQHFRYLKLWRERIDDRQRLFYLCGYLSNSAEIASCTWGVADNIRFTGVSNLQVFSK